MGIIQNSRSWCGCWCGQVAPQSTFGADVMWCYWLAGQSVCRMMHFCRTGLGQLEAVSINLPVWKDGKILSSFLIDYWFNTFLQINFDVDSWYFFHKKHFSITIPSSSIATQHSISLTVCAKGSNSVSRPPFPLRVGHSDARPFSLLWPSSSGQYP